MGSSGGVRGVDEAGGVEKGVFAIVIFVGEYTVVQCVAFVFICIETAEDYDHNVGI